METKILRDSDLRIKGLKVEGIKMSAEARKEFEKNKK